MEVDAKLMFTRMFDACLGVDVVLCEIECEEILAGRVSKYTNIQTSKESLVAVDCENESEREIENVYTSTAKNALSFFLLFCLKITFLWQLGFHRMYV